MKEDIILHTRAVKLISACLSAGIAVGSITTHECGSSKEVALQSPMLLASGSSFNIFEDSYEEEDVEAIETAFVPVSYGNASLNINDYTFVAMTSYTDVASEFGNNPADPITYDGGKYWINSDVIVIAAKNEKPSEVEANKPDNNVADTDENSEEDSEENSEEDTGVKNLVIGDSVIRISYTNVWSLVKLESGFQGFVRNSILSDTEITPVPTATPTPTDTPTPTPKPASRNTNTPTPKPKATATPVPSSDEDSSSGSSSSSSDYKETEISKTVYASCALNTRSGPGISYSLLSTLSVGTAISVVAETDNGWYKSSSGYYVKASLCLDNEPTATPTPEPSSSSGGSSSMGDTSTDFATFIKSFIGCKYVSGGASPSGFDCSGFVMYCYKTYYGIDLPHGATSQSYKGYEVDPDDIQVGDIICFDRNGDGTMEHSALYVGNDTYVHAQSSKTGVVASTYSSAKNIAHIRRVL